MFYVLLLFEDFDRGLLHFLHARVDEIMKFKSTHDQMMCLIFLFLDQFQISDKVPFRNPSRLETLKRFWMEMFNFSEFDL